SQALMHSPLSMQALAHLRDISGPSPVRTMSRMPAIVVCGSAPATPAGSLMGQASKHLPHVVQASTMTSTRAESAVWKALVMVVPTVVAAYTGTLHSTNGHFHFR